MKEQLNLFPFVAEAYAESGSGALDNEQLYADVAEKAGLAPEDLQRRMPIGSKATMRSPVKRKIRWYQQTLKHLGILEKVPGRRGLWRLTEGAGKGLQRAAAGVKLVAFSTDLGVAIWGHNQDVFGLMDEPITLCVTSPPYPLRQPRAYGNPAEGEYVDFICSSLEPIVRKLTPGGSVVINISNDIFEPGSPERSLYVERLVLALNDRLGLRLMDRIPWINLSKPPGPTHWACVKKIHLSSGYEPIFWFTNAPQKVGSDTRRVLEAHTARHLALMRAGGENRTAEYGDGAYKLQPRAFGRSTEGKLPRNIIQRGHSCRDTVEYRRCASALGLPLHGALQPTAISDFFIRFLTRPEDLVVDPFGGVAKTGLAAERLGRRWLVTEWILQYARGAAELFRAAPGYRSHPLLEMIG